MLSCSAICNVWLNREGYAFHESFFKFETVRVDYFRFNFFYDHRVTVRVSKQV